MKKLVLGLIILLLGVVMPVNAIEFHKLETPTLDILNEIENNAQMHISVNGLSNEQLLMLLDKNYNFKIDKDEVSEAIKMYFDGEITLEQAVMVIQYCINETKFVKVITAKQIKGEIDTKDRLVLCLDNIYYLGNPYASLDMIKKSGKVHEEWYEIPYYDCDDYAWLGMGILHEKKEPAATATFYTLVLFNWRGHIYGHALLLVKALDGKWYYVDPTTMKVFEKDAVPFQIIFMMG